MKKNKNIIITLIVIIGVFIIGFVINELNNKDIVKENLGQATQESLQKVIEGEDDVDENIKEQEKIEKTEDEVFKEEPTDDLDSSNYEENNDYEEAEDVADTTEEEIQLENELINIPYKIPNKEITIENIAQYTGPFIENGTDTPKANVLSLLIKNNSKEMLQYAEIYLKINNENEVVFKVSTIPAGASAVVLESTGNVEFNSKDKFYYEEAISAKLSNVSLMEDVIQITKSNKKIGIKNISNEELKTVYVYYKYTKKDSGYLGGITYRSKFENVKADEYIEVDAKHFSVEASEIIMVDYIN